MPENQTAWNSGNQGVKETFTQTGVPKQRNKTQMKEQIKTPEKEWNEVEMSNLWDAEFKTLFIRMPKDTLIEIKNNSQENNNRVDEAENQINDLEHKEAKTTNQENKKKKKIQKQNEHSISRLCDNFKHSNIRITRVPEEEEKEQEIKNLFEK